LQRAIVRYLEANERDKSTREIESANIDEARAENVVVRSAAADLDMDDFGILDFQEMAEAALGVSLSSLEKLNNTMNEMTAETDRLLENVQQVSAPNTSAAERKKVINGFADFLKSKSIDLQTDSSVAGENFAIFCSSVLSAVRIEREQMDQEKYNREVQNFRTVAENVQETLIKSRGSFVALMSIIENLPRITIQFNQAKRMLIGALGDCLKMYSDSEAALIEIVRKL
jgi:hypothetical protein